MSVAKDCQRYAVRCLQDARTTVDPRQKTFLKQFPAYLNRWDSQQARNEGVFAH